jgi:hypothetical protein
MAISNNSTGLRPGVCTSTTRPTAPYEGQHIYETDTDIEYVWSGSAWVVNYVSAASPAFTGTPTAPTAAAGTNTTQLATTAFTTTAVSNIRVGAVPNFLVYFSGGNGAVHNGNYLAYNTEYYDDTNNVVSGVFTVPAGQAGVYQFNVAANCYNIGSSGYFRITIVTAAIDIHGSQTPAQGGSDVFSIASATLKLAVGDTVRVRWVVPASGSYSAGIHYNSFSGVRIA